ncbi:alpha-N-acetylglucosaminidase isoform X2 [Selaginella moellendorffii]|uniref:alpha-N-acetylglucosaminidase isoform X2 n=1 Tax=Selaginella moellendorffii TaxID=88036 RepID=UPI000D1CAED5|nr:alpha-N-acetylglucosaminidase isoform X2 [Selaginella moellendorffii]|eukprot:XP_024535814.1 alpha-N-acetylglucosaminidase isoform X2 [Selaginella moellendorffii]
MALGILAALLCLLAGARASPIDEDAWRELRSTMPPARDQLRAAASVLRRLIPGHASAFQLQIITLEDCGGKSCFQLSSLMDEGSRKISIHGTSGVELCAGLYWYLKNWCGAHISWDLTGGSQLDTIPEPQALPALPPGGVKIQRSVPWSYYQNVVTSSYSYAWWNWKRWRKEIDWMALQGINLPLAFTGQETIWQKVFESKFNMTKHELDDYFGGPSFLAWARMGNLHGWGGPLPEKWLELQLILQKKILHHMRSLGMIAVLPAFSGNVPRALKILYPSANITRLPDWNTVDGNPQWCCTYLLQPMDPLFIQIGKAFIEQQVKEYGSTQHVYNCDTFNENLPPTDDPSYISALAASVYGAMIVADKQAIWLMQVTYYVVEALGYYHILLQGWLFSSDAQFWKPPQMKALLHAVPFGKMIVLDLFAEVRPIWSKSSHFYGVPYIWCMLHNFGGNHEMYGRLDVVSSGPVDAKTSANSTMIGVGMCMEGIEQNPVVYELMAEMAFRSTRNALKDWVNDYSTRRYGKAVPEALEAWQILSHTLYNCSDGLQDHNTDVIVKFPDLNASSLTTLSRYLAEEAGTQTRRLLTEGLTSFGHLWYRPTEAKVALSYMLNASSSLSNVATYRYDLVDLTRQVLMKLANQIHLQALVSFVKGDLEELTKNCDILIGIIKDSELLLRSNNGFLLGPWLESAKKLGTNSDEKHLYEWNARTQVTMWFDNTRSLPSALHDYANKMWSGLFEDYYLPRASLYTKLLVKALHDKEPFPYGSWRSSWILLTNTFQNGTKNYPLEAAGDSIEIAKSLFSKYDSLVHD